jgi:phosphatidate phosphatase PAH1
MFGRDWTHSGIADFYSNVARNGYVFLYLTTRSIVQAGLTTRLIQNTKLPDGPVMTSPDLILHCLAREVILKTPQEFKIAALRKVQSLFTPKRSPHCFYAGLGNRPTDRISYETVGIAASKVFLIDTMSTLRIHNVVFESYASVNDAVDHIFPPIRLDQTSPPRRPHSSGASDVGESDGIALTDDTVIVVDEPMTSTYADFLYWKPTSVWLDVLQQEILAQDAAARNTSVKK